MRSFITAKLRKESGASISPSEFADARSQYFPSLNDDENTLLEKKKLRDSVLNNAILGSGSAYQKQEESDPTESYYKTTSSVILNSSEPKNKFLQEYSNRNK